MTASAFLKSWFGKLIIYKYAEYASLARGGAGQFFFLPALLFSLANLLHSPETVFGKGGRP